MIEIKGDVIRRQLIERIEKYSHTYPELKFKFLVNEKSEESVSYVKMLKRFCDALGITYSVTKVTDDNQEECLDTLNSPDTMVIVSRPLLVKKESEFIERLNPNYDPDMLTTLNMGRLVKGDVRYLSGTARSVLLLIENYNIPLVGKRVLVIGRSISVGMPIFLSLQKKGAYCQLAHSKVDKEEIRKSARVSDIIILASGQTDLLTIDDIPSSSYVIDCGYHDDGKGDMKFVPNCLGYTPVPGGVGPLTIASVIENGYILHEIGKKDAD